MGLVTDDRVSGDEGGMGQEGPGGLQKKIVVGRRIQAGGRSLWPVMQALIWMREDRVLIARVKPFALLIIEEGKEYALSLTGRPVTVQELLESAPEVRAALEEACSARRVDID